MGVFAPVPRCEALPCCLVSLRFLLDSEPLSSERLGEPVRLIEFAIAMRWVGSRCLPGRLAGVLLPLVELPEAGAAFLSWSFSFSLDSDLTEASLSDDSELD